MLADVTQHLPEEACGVITGQKGQGLEVIPIENILHSPVGFRMSPDEQVKVLLQIEEKGLDLIAIYHSHPNGPEEPSTTDIAEANYPEAVNLIWFPKEDQWQCRGFRIINGTIEEVPIIIT
jgi:proteasome lid subunit RPN8/RPN11